MSGIRILIVASKENLAEYSEFREALKPVGIEATCVDILKGGSLSEFRPLHTIPVPRLLGISSTLILTSR